MVHNKNQTVFAECLVLQKMLLLNFVNIAQDLRDIKENYMNVVSGFW